MKLEDLRKRLAETGTKTSQTILAECDCGFEGEVELYQVEVSIVVDNAPSLSTTRMSKEWTCPKCGASYQGEP